MTYLNFYSIEAEQTILGKIILNNDSWNLVFENLDRNDFYKKEHQVIFDMMQFLASRNEPIDQITLINLLKKTSVTDKTNSKTYIHALAKNTLNPDDILPHINIIKKKSTLRKIIKTSKEIVEYTIKNENKDINEIIEYIEQKITSISQKINKHDDSFIDLSKILSTTVKKIEILYETKTHITGLASGFKELDTITSGFHGSDLIIIAGRPSMGKSTLAINIAENVLMNTSKSVILFSMEMPAEQIIIRMLSSLGKINLQKLRNGSIDKLDWPKLNASVSLLSDKNLFIDDSGALTPFDIKTKVKKIDKMYKNVGLVIIDYIQLIKIPGLQDSRAREIAEISRALKILAKEINAPIIVLSQLNRSLEQRNDKRPLMSDLRESGAIEQDADLILFIYRDDMYMDKEQKKSEIIIAKQRNGPIGKINLKFLPEYCKFDNIN